MEFVTVIEQDKLLDLKVRAGVNGLSASTSVPDLRTCCRKLLNEYNREALSSNAEKRVIALSWLVRADRQTCKNLLMCGSVPREHAPRVSDDATQHAPQTVIDIEPEPVETQPVETPDPVASTSTSDASDSDDFARLNQALKNILSAGHGAVDENQVRNIVREELKDTILPRKIEVTRRETGETITIDRAHVLFELCLRGVQAGANLCLVGDAGGGKSTIGAQIAQAMGLKFFANSTSETTSATDFLGYTNAMGEYVRTPFRDAYEHGGVFLLDEVDAGGASLVVLNSALANDYCMFPDKMVKRNSDFILISTANTFGFGGDRMYTRNQLDGATLDRLWAVAFDYDESLEAALIGATWEPEVIDIARGGIMTDPNEWFQRVRALRYAARELRERILITPRATIQGWRMMQSGIGSYWVEHGLIWKGRDSSIMHKICEKAGLPVLS